ncbi:myotubularin-related protein 13-like isoform X8 [Octopus vulgaris]|uniref:Myotubularin-related protein 13-like isoform X8 n=1 Tax=Octopus vulgaris TaxID=6645 RepID=A0AA36AV41_OCTVU|nr:myotubularin-related protein 13-like isoform X8 [Octopus vulgaris]
MGIGEMRGCHKGSGVSCGKTLQRFPENDWDDCPYTQGVELFCQPAGWQLSTQRLQPTFFAAVLTDIDADRHYCACMTFNEAVAMTPTKPDDEEEEQDGSGLVHHSLMFAPKTILLVSRMNNFEALKNCLGIIYTVFIENLQYSLETIIGNILGCVHVPPSGGPQVRFSIGGGDRQALQPPLSNTIPVTNSSVALLFSQFEHTSRAHVLKPRVLLPEVEVNFVCEATTRHCIFEKDIFTFGVVYLRVLKTSENLRPNTKLLKKILKIFASRNIGTLFFSFVYKIQGIQEYRRYKISAGASSTVGIANVGAMCTVQSVSVVVQNGGFTEVLIAAHEIGHSLNSKHDGIDNECLESDSYIMSASVVNNQSPSQKLNSFLFSPCSINTMKRFVQDLSNNCLENPGKLFNDIPTVSRPTGQVYSPQEQCRTFTGSTGLCSIFFNQSLSQLCLNLQCLEGANSCREQHAAHKTSCGSKKWCVSGKCVYDTAAPKIDDFPIHPVIHSFHIFSEKCPFGDNENLRFTVIFPGSDKTIVPSNCRQLLELVPGVCVNQAQRAHCCKTCNPDKDMFNPYFQPLDNFFPVSNSLLLDSTSQILKSILALENLNDSMALENFPVVKMKPLMKEQNINQSKFDSQIYTISTGVSSLNINSRLLNINTSYVYSFKQQPHTQINSDSPFDEMMSESQIFSSSFALKSSQPYISPIFQTTSKLLSETQTRSDFDLNAKQYFTQKNFYSLSTLKDLITKKSVSTETENLHGALIIYSTQQMLWANSKTESMSPYKYDQTKLFVLHPSQSQISQIDEIESLYPINKNQIFLYNDHFLGSFQSAISQSYLSPFKHFTTNERPFSDLKFSLSGNTFASVNDPASSTFRRPITNSLESNSLHQPKFIKLTISQLISAYFDESQIHFDSKELLYMATAAAISEIPQQQAKWLSNSFNFQKSFHNNLYQSIIPMSHFNDNQSLLPSLKSEIWDVSNEFWKSKLEPVIMKSPEANLFGSNSDNLVPTLRHRTTDIVNPTQSMLQYFLENLYTESMTIDEFDTKESPHLSNTEILEPSEAVSLVNVEDLLLRTLQNIFPSFVSLGKTNTDTSFTSSSEELFHLLNSGLSFHTQPSHSMELLQPSTHTYIPITDLSELSLASSQIQMPLSFQSPVNFDLMNKFSSPNMIFYSDSEQILQTSPENFQPSLTMTKSNVFSEGHDSYVYDSLRSKLEIITAPKDSFDKTQSYSNHVISSHIPELIDSYSSSSTLEIPENIYFSKSLLPLTSLKNLISTSLTPEVIYSNPFLPNSIQFDDPKFSLYSLEIIEISSMIDQFTQELPLITPPVFGNTIESNFKYSPTTSTSSQSSDFISSTENGNTSILASSYSIIKVRSDIDVNSFEFKHGMEERLARSYVEAYKRGEHILNGTYRPLRKKRFAVVKDIALQIMKIVHFNHGTSQNVSLVYYMEKNGRPVPAKDAIKHMNLIQLQELAIYLNHVVVLRAEAYLKTPDGKYTENWIIGVVLGSVAVVLLFMWCVLFIFFKCFRHPPLKIQEVKPINSCLASSLQEIKCNPELVPEDLISKKENQRSLEERDSLKNQNEIEKHYVKIPLEEMSKPKNIKKSSNKKSCQIVSEEQEVPVKNKKLKAKLAQSVGSTKGNKHL